MKALIVIDMLDDFVTGVLPNEAQAMQIVPAIRRLIGYAREQPDWLVVRFQHLPPSTARSRANVGIIRTTSNFMILVELLNLTFERELAAGGTQMSNSFH